MLSRGSEWRRWEPHVHAPGTVMNNQFSGPNAWDDYLQTSSNRLKKSERIVQNIDKTIVL